MELFGDFCLHTLRQVTIVLEQLSIQEALWLHSHIVHINILIQSREKINKKTIPSNYL